MGTITEDYTKQKITALTELFQNFIIEDNKVIISIPQKRLDEYIDARDELYKNYCIPMILNGSYFVLTGYSANKFLKLMTSIKSYRGSRKDKIRTLINITDNAAVTVYAAGPIEDADDNGVGSREELKASVKDSRISVISPCDFSYNQSEYPTMKSYQAAHTVQETMEYAKPIVRGDVLAVQDTDLTLVYMSHKAGPGTASECTLAMALGKPVYGIAPSKEDLEKIHPWILGCVTKVFNSFEEFRKFAE